MRRSKARRESERGREKRRKNRSMGGKEGRKEVEGRQVSAQAMMGLAVNYMRPHPYAADFIALSIKDYVLHVLR
jgi:hypothetical protein